MPRTRKPRAGSMQFWPRVRAQRPYARVRHWPISTDAKPLGFAGYKVGMTHVSFIDPRKNALTKGEQVTFPVTIVECPPLKIYGVKLFKKGLFGLNVVKEFLVKADKELGRKVKLPKKEKKFENIKPEDYDDVRLLVYTQPKLTGIGKKKPELFEMGIGGSVAEKIEYAKENLGKEIFVKDILKEGQQLDTHIITTGKGFQGALKRFGIHRTPAKSEKDKRTPGTLGGWVAQGHFMYRVPHAGNMGFNQRKEYNKLVLKIGDKPEEVNPKGGFIRYGLVKNNYLIVKGSLAGPSKRLLKFSIASRPNKKYEGFVPELKYVSLESKQRR